MEVEINDKDLLRLYETGYSKKLKLPSDVSDKFFLRIQSVQAAQTIHDLWKDRSINFEKLQGYANRYSLRLNLKWRLEMEVTWENNDKTIGRFLVAAVSNHYKQ